MLGDFYASLFDLSASVHLIAASLFALVTAILLSPNNENFASKKFYLFCLLACVTQIIIFVHKAGWIDINWVSIAKCTVSVSIVIVLWRLLLSSSDSDKPRQLKWCLPCLLLVIVGEALRLLPEFSSIVRTNLETLGSYQHMVHIVPLAGLLFTLLLSEQVFRNGAIESRVTTRPLFIAIWLWLSAYIYQTGYTFLIGEYEPNFYRFSGFYDLVAAGIMLVGSSRTTHEQSFMMTRESAFYGSSLTLSSIALILMSIVNYSVSAANVTWLNGLTMFLIVSTIVGTLFLIISTSARSQIRVIINKSFFGGKYDYRKIWLSLINRLSFSDQTNKFHEISLASLAEIFNADGGALWVQQQPQEFSLAHSENVEIEEHAKNILLQEPYILPMLEKDWIYTPSTNKNADAAKYNHLLPSWLINLPNVWIVAPLLVAEELVGFFVLTSNKKGTSFIWEDLDVARAAGRQIASYIVRHQSAEKLAESKQFDTYNQLTAFIMHDLKNLIAQQALVVKNASKHKDNPAFIEDMIRTIDNSVQRMNALLQRLKRTEDSSPLRTADLKKVLLETIRNSTDRQPIPTLRNQHFELSIQADVEQLTMVLMHLVRNAQDATANDGFIDIDITQASNKNIVVSIEDNGAGMSQDFIKNRLFKPFESTKSSMGMGIGAYQARNFVRAMGGDITVESQIDIGTKVTVILPNA